MLGGNIIKRRVCFFPELSSSLQLLLCPVPTSASDSPEPTLTSPLMGSANLELMGWYEMILEPAMDTYFETNPDLTWVATTIQPERKPSPLVLVGAKDETLADGTNSSK